MGALFNRVFLIGNIAKVTAIQNGDFIVTKRFERPVHPSRAAHIQSVRAPAVDDHMIVIGDTQTANKLFKFCNWRHLAGRVVYFGTPTSG